MNLNSVAELDLLAPVGKLAPCLTSLPFFQVLLSFFIPAVPSSVAILCKLKQSHPEGEARFIRSRKLIKLTRLRKFIKLSRLKKFRKF